MKDTQIKFVKSRLKQTGFISRNFCLEMFISRLGAIIANLKEQGYEFEAYYQDTERGKDYVYEWINKPKAPIVKINTETRQVQLNY